ncbi:MAG: hypothetical protein QM764_06055 [Chitinophagaceae bacterium]
MADDMSNEESVMSSCTLIIHYSSLISCRKDSGLEINGFKDLNILPMNGFDTPGVRLV